MINRSKLITYCNAIIEMGWLAALIVVPLFFNPHSARIFEPDKVSLLATIALTMLTAWLVKLVAHIPPNSNTIQGDSPSQSRTFEPKESRSSKYLLQKLWATPLAIPSLLFLLAYVISSFLSISPTDSWWGVYGRTQGTYTLLSIAIIALLAALHLRHAQQLHRIQFAIILTSFPIAAYGVIQHWGNDPVNINILDKRVVANLGNAVYLAAYLTMAFFVTLERLYTACQNFYLYLRSENSLLRNTTVPYTLLHLITISIYLVVMGTQITTIVLTQSRGPILGLGAGFGFALLVGFVTLWRKQKRWILLTLASICLLGLLCFVLFRLSSLNAPPAFDRITNQLVNPNSQTARSRFLIWQSMEELYTQSAPITYPDQEKDSLDFWRPLIGYGPDTLGLIAVTVYPFELLYIDNYTKALDHAHNATWQLLLSVGLLGHVAYLFLYCQIFYWILRWLSLLITRRDRVLFYALLFASTILLTALAFIYTGGWSLIGLTLPFGLLMGLLIYIITVTAMGRRATASEILTQNNLPIRSSEQTLMLILILAIVVSHLVETSFGIIISTTQFIFWFMVAVLAVIPLSASASNNTVSSIDSDRTIFGQSAMMLHGLIFLTFVFLYSLNHQASVSWFTILINTLTASVNEDGTVLANLSVFWLLVGTWLIGTCLALVAPLCLPNTKRENNVPANIPMNILGRNRVLVYSAVVWGGWLLYSFIQSNLLVITERMTVYDSGMRQSSLFALYSWLLVLWIVVASWVDFGQGKFRWKISQKRRRRRMAEGQGGAIGIGLFLCLLCLLMIHHINIKPVRADGLFGIAQRVQSNHFVESFMLYQQAIKLNRTEPIYPITLANLLFEKAKAPDQPSESSDDVASQTEQALAFTMPQLLTLTPVQIQAMTEVTLLNSSDTLASSVMDQAALNTNSRMLKAKILHRRAELTEDAQQKDALLAESLDLLERLLQIGPHLAQIWDIKGGVLMAAGRLEEAEETYLHSLSINSLNWMTYHSLLIFYMETQNYTKHMELSQRILDRQLLNRNRFYLEISSNRQSQRRESVQTFVYSGLMQAHYQLGNYEDALQAALQANKLQPDDLAFFRYLITIYTELEQYQKAIEWSKNGLAQLGTDQPNEMFEFYQYLLQIYETLDQSAEISSTDFLLDDPEISKIESADTTIPSPDPRSKTWQNYHKFPPDYLMIVRELTALYRDEHEFSEAIQWAKQGISQLADGQTVEIVEFHWMLVKLYDQTDEVDQDEYADVINVLQTHLPAGPIPDDWIIIRTLFNLHKEKEHYPEAIFWLNQGIKRLEPHQRAEQIEFHQALVELYSAIDDQEGLIHAYEVLRSYSPDNINILENLYLLYYQEADESKLIEVLQALGTLVPDNYVYPFLLAQLYELTAEFDKAREFAEQALTIVPDTARQKIVDFLASLE